MINLQLIRVLIWLLGGYFVVLATQLYISWFAGNKATFVGYIAPHSWIADVVYTWQNVASKLYNKKIPLAMLMRTQEKSIGMTGLVLMGGLGGSQFEDQSGVIPK